MDVSQRRRDQEMVEGGGGRRKEELGWGVHVPTGGGREERRQGQGRARTRGYYVRVPVSPEKWPHVLIRAWHLDTNGIF